MDILDDMGVNKISAEVFVKVNYSFKQEGLRTDAEIVLFLLHV